jgi:hypothetical protein
MICGNARNVTERPGKWGALGNLFERPGYQPPRGGDKRAILFVVERTYATAPPNGPGWWIIGPSFSLACRIDFGLLQ